MLGRFSVYICSLINGCLVSSKRNARMQHRQNTDDCQPNKTSCHLVKQSRQMRWMELYSWRICGLLSRFVAFCLVAVPC
jgi:hypothetical protein